MLFFRHGPNTTRFLEGWQESLEKDDKTWDQNAFNWLVHDGLLPFKSHPSNPRLVRMASAREGPECHLHSFRACRTKGGVVGEKGQDVYHTLRTCC